MPKRVTWSPTWTALIGLAVGLTMANPATHFRFKRAKRPHYTARPGHLQPSSRCTCPHLCLHLTQHLPTPTRPPRTGSQWRGGGGGRCPSGRWKPRRALMATDLSECRATALPTMLGVGSVSAREQGSAQRAVHSKTAGRSTQDSTWSQAPHPI